MSSIQTVWGFIRRHKYFVVIAFFVAMLGFVDENSFWDRHLRLQEIAALKAEMRSYQHKFEEDSKALDELENNPEAVVRMAREKYLMKYPQEDVYVFLDAAQDGQENAAEDEETL